MARDFELTQQQVQDLLQVVYTRNDRDWEWLLKYLRDEFWGSATDAGRVVRCYQDDNYWNAPRNSPERAKMWRTYDRS